MDCLDSLDRELHALAQPLASLQLRLEIGKMSGEPMELADAIKGSLEDLVRVKAILARLRSISAISGRNA